MSAAATGLMVGWFYGVIGGIYALHLACYHMDRGYAPASNRLLWLWGALWPLLLVREVVLRGIVFPRRRKRRARIAASLPPEP